MRQSARICLKRMLKVDLKRKKKKKAGTFHCCNVTELWFATAIRKKKKPLGLCHERERARERERLSERGLKLIKVNRINLFCNPSDPTIRLC